MRLGKSLPLVLFLAGTSVWGLEVSSFDGSDEVLLVESVVPRPQTWVPLPDPWIIPRKIVVDWGPLSPDEVATLSLRLDLLWRPAGISWSSRVGPEQSSLRFHVASALPRGESEYTLRISASGIDISASRADGRFAALMTLTQLFTVSPTPRTGRGFPGLEIHDWARFPWRGLMVDSARHFLPVDEILRILELMALHKMNRFHWHLTDDQGWRFPVSGWPRLTEVGSQRVEPDGTLTAGFYTVDDIRRVVNFAAARQIVVVPEVDLPGHASAALAAYPELSARGLPRPVPTEWGVADGVLSLGRSSVDRFTHDVLRTLVELFPGPWIHWGGDEVFRSPWVRNSESQRWLQKNNIQSTDGAVALFWRNLAQATLVAGKVPLGWDDVATYDPPSGTLIQWWDDPARANRALGNGLSVIVSVKESLYLDYPEWAGDPDQAWWMPTLTLEDIASVPFLPEGSSTDHQGQIVGLEATLFSERVEAPRWGRKLFPRLALVAEQAWTGVPGGAPQWDLRIAVHRERLEAWGVGMPEPVR